VPTRFVKHADQRQVFKCPMSNSRAHSSCTTPERTAEGHTKLLLDMQGWIPEPHWDSCCSTSTLKLALCRRRYAELRPSPTLQAKHSHGQFKANASASMWQQLKAARPSCLQLRPEGLAKANGHATLRMQPAQPQSRIACQLLRGQSHAAPALSIMG